MAVERSRKGISCGAVAAGMALLVAAAALVGAWGYFRFLHYDPVAARHIPADTVAAARVDVEEGVLYDPVRHHLLPVLMQAIGRESTDALTRRFERATGLERSGLREVVALRGATWSDWTLIVAGLFPKGALVQRIHDFLAAEGVTGWAPAGTPGKLVHEPSGTALGQAEDGALVLASSRGQLDAALPSRAAPEALGLDVEAPLSFAATGVLLREIASHPSALGAPALGELARARRVRGTADLGDRLGVRVLLDPSPGTSGVELHGVVERLLVAFRTMARLTSGGGLAGERTVLERAVIDPPGSDFVAISSTWTREEADRGARSLARAIESWIGPPPARAR